MTVPPKNPKTPATKAKAKPKAEPKPKKTTESAPALGGRARAKKLTKEARSDIARGAALVRWGTGPVLATHGSADRPLRIGGIEIPCYILADGRRVLSQSGLLAGIGMSVGGGRGGERKLVSFLEQVQKKGIDVKGLIASVNSPIHFIPPRGGNPAYGYEATILPDLCAVLIDAGRQRKLHARLEHLPQRCGVLQHGFATVGIVALVDEATGYQDVRARDALAEILEKFVAKEIRPWVKTFPSNFYQEIFRLNGWKYEENCGRPMVIANYTTNIVYKRLAPGVWAELKRVAPKNDKGRPKAKLFQSLTDDVGHPRLREHLAAVTMLMKYSPTWLVFQDRLDREFPQWGKTMPLPFPDNYEAPPNE